MEFLRLHCTYKENDCYLIARSHGYYFPCTWDGIKFGYFYVALIESARKVPAIKPRSSFPVIILFSKEGHELKRWYTRGWMEYDAVKNNTSDIAELRKSLEDAVQLMSDVPYGVVAFRRIRFVHHLGGHKKNLPLKD